jgi:hypothetical protein
MWHSSGARRGPEVIYYAQCMSLSKVQDDGFSRDQANPATHLASPLVLKGGWCVDEAGPVEVVDLGGARRLSSRTMLLY